MPWILLNLGLESMVSDNFSLALAKMELVFKELDKLRMNQTNL